MKYVLTFLSSFFVFAGINAQLTWLPVGANGTASLSTAIYCDMVVIGNTPYVAFSDNILANKVTVMKYNGSNWESVGLGGFSAGQALDIQITADGNTPYVVYRDVMNSNKATVKKFDGTSWVTVGNAGFSPGAVSSTDITVLGGTPYVVYQDQTYSNRAAVKKFDGSNWVNVGGVAATNYTVSEGEANNISIGNDGSSPYILYRDEWASQKATMKSFDGAIWETVGVAGFSAGIVDYLSMTFTGSVPFVSYRELGTANNQKAIVKTFNSTSWLSVGSPVSVGSAQYTSVAIINGSPYLAYRDDVNGGRMSVKRYNNIDWEDIGDPGFSYGPVEYISLGSASGVPYVVSRDAGQGNKATVMKYDNCTAPFFVGLSQNPVACDSAQVGLTATANDGVVNWYGTPGGMVIYSGSNFTTPMLYNTTTYFVQADNGCDTSVMLSIEVTINHGPSSLEEYHICRGESITVGGNTYSESGMYTVYYPSVDCDSAAVVSIVVNDLDTGTTVTGTTISSLQRTGTYQWIDCGNGNAVISGATSQTYTATVSGSYAVILNDGNCSDTSSCVSIEIETNAISENGINNILQLSPNPTGNNFTITWPSYDKNVSADIFDVTGKKIKSVILYGIQNQVDVAELKSGIYWLKIHLPNGMQTIKFVKE